MRTWWVDSDIASIAVVLACCLLVFQRFTSDRWRRRFGAIGSPLIEPPACSVISFGDHRNPAHFDASGSGLCAARIGCRRARYRDHSGCVRTAPLLDFCGSNSGHSDKRRRLPRRTYTVVVCVHVAGDLDPDAHGHDECVAASARLMRPTNVRLRKRRSCRRHSVNGGHWIPWHQCSCFTAAYSGSGSSSIHGTFSAWNSISTSLCPLDRSYAAVPGRIR